MIDSSMGNQVAETTELWKAYRRTHPPLAYLRQLTASRPRSIVPKAETQPRLEIPLRKCRMCRKLKEHKEFRAHHGEAKRICKECPLHQRKPNQRQRKQFNAESRQLSKMDKAIEAFKEANQYLLKHCSREYYQELQRIRDRFQSRERFRQDSIWNLKHPYRG